MLKNYFRVAWRNIVKKPFFSSVNIIGLSTGLAFAMIIGSYVWTELNVNSQLKNEDRQFVIQSKWKDSNQGMELTSTGMMAKALRDNYPSLVANYYRWDGITSTVSKGEKAYREGLQIGDSTFINMYGFRLLYGNESTAFTEPYSIVITADKARKYFGKENVLGETLNIESFSGAKHDFRITGVLAAFPRNSVTHITDNNDNQIYLSQADIDYFGRTMTWNDNFILNYVELQKGVKPEDLVQPMKQLMKTNAQAFVVDNMTPFLVSMKDYHINAFNGIIKKTIYALTAIASFILLMALINFINLSVSRSSTRMREIGIRKVMGGVKKQLIIQFLIESIVLVMIATMIALLLYFLTKDLFSYLLDTRLPGRKDFPVYFIAYPFIIVVVIGLLAGSYPALVLSAMKPIESLKGKLASVKDRIWLRKSLIAVQFGIAIIVFSGAVIISKQINLFFKSDLGYDKDNIVSFQMPRNWSREGIQKMEVVRSQMAKIPAVLQTSVSFEIPDGLNGGNTSIYKLGTDSTTAVIANLLQTDQYYAKTFGIQMAGGKFFADDGMPVDSTSIVINETQAKLLGYKNSADAVNTSVRFPGFNGIFTITGVTKDFHFGSMSQPIGPIVFGNVEWTNTYRFLSIKFKKGNISESIDAARKKWSQLMPNAPFEYKFMDESLQKIYKIELQLKSASLTATILSIIIVLLGVLGLVALNVQKRTKEIGIRKVLGASVPSIITLFIKDFLGTIILAGIVACPVAWLIMKNWLSDYSYRITLNATPFLAALAGLTVLTAILISLQTLKAGLTNPVKSLRTE